MSSKFLGIALFLTVAAAQGANSVLTRSFDNARTGANVSEAVFTPDSIANRQLKRIKILDIPDDPRMEAHRHVR